MRGPVDPQLRILVPNGSTYFKLNATGGGSSGSSSSGLSGGAIAGIAVGAVAAAAALAGLLWWGLARRRQSQGQQPKAATEEGKVTSDSSSSELPPAGTGSNGKRLALGTPTESGSLPHMSVRSGVSSPKSPFQVPPPFRAMRSSSNGLKPSTPDGCATPPLAELVQVRQGLK